jgi:hypothetical protein
LTTGCSGAYWDLGLDGCASRIPTHASLGLLHDHVVIVGNTLAERMQYFGNFEKALPTTGAISSIMHRTW